MALQLDAQAVSVVVASVSVVAGVVYYIVEARHQRKVRRTENLIRLSPWFNVDAREIQESLALICSVNYSGVDDYFAKYGGRPEQVAFKLIGNYIEGIGVLVSRGLVEEDLVYEFWGDIVLSTWRDYEAVIRAMRERSGEPRMYEHWERLASDVAGRKAGAVGR